jgi:hypothetical protein
MVQVFEPETPVHLVICPGVPLPVTDEAAKGALDCLLTFAFIAGRCSCASALLRVITTISAVTILFQLFFVILISFLLRRIKMGADKKGAMFEFF